MSRHRQRAGVIVGSALLAVGIIGTGVAIAAGSRGPGFGGGGMMAGSPMGGAPWGAQRGSVCTPASSPSVRYIGVDGGRMMGGSMNRLMPRTVRVPAGAITIDLVNRGTRAHELLVFPLPSSERAGMRDVGIDDRVSEAGSLGEVSPVCVQPGDVDGIAPGNTGRVTLRLRPGRYEVVCNLPGHYRTGMWAELDVLGSAGDSRGSSAAA